MLEINNYAYSSRIAGKKPQYKIIFAAVPLLGCLFADSLAVSSFTLIVMGLMSVFNTNITWQKYLKLLIIPLGFLSLGTITIILQQYPVGQPVLLGFEFNNSIYGVDSTSLSYGVNLILRALAAVSCMYFISLTTPLNDIVYALRAIKVPSLFISLLVLTHRLNYACSP